MRSREQLNPDRDAPVLDQDIEQGAQEKEKMSAESILMDLKERGNRFFDSEGVRDGLLEKGIEDKDIRAAIDLMACIASLDEGTGIKGDLSLKFSVAPNEFGDIAGCLNDEEGYAVDVRGISDNIFESIHRIPGVDNEGNPIGSYDDWEKPTMAELLISVAAHEVRHRLQQHGLPMINAEKIKDYDDSLFKDIAEHVSSLLEEEERQYKKENRSAEYIERKTSPLELDARVIEMMTLIKLHSGTTKEDLQRLLKFQGLSSDGKSS